MSIDLASLTARLSPEEQRTVKARYRAQAKNPTTAFLLCFFLGLFGVHRFYLGDVAGGVVRLVLFPLIIPGLILEIIDLPRIDAEVAHHNLATAEGIIARVMLDHPDQRFESQASQLVDASLAQAAGQAPMPAAPAPAQVAAPLSAAATAAVPESTPRAPEPPPAAYAAPEIAPPVTAAPAAEVAPAPVAEAADPLPPIWPIPAEYHPEPAAAPPELRHETDTTPYPPMSAEQPHSAPAAAPQEAHTVPWGEVAVGAAAGEMAAAILTTHDEPATTPPAAIRARADVDQTDQAAQLAEGSALADVGEPLGERVQVRLPGTDATESTLVFHTEDAPVTPARELDWGEAAGIGAGTLGGLAAYEAFAHHEPGPIEEPPATANAPTSLSETVSVSSPLMPTTPNPGAETAPAAAPPEYRTVKRVRVVRRLMVDGKVVQETAAEEVVDADADTAATAARLREELGATDPDTLASLAQQSVDSERKP
jgi:hypothetical protein